MERRLVAIYRAGKNVDLVESDATDYELYKQYGCPLVLISFPAGFERARELSESDEWQNATARLLETEAKISPVIAGHEEFGEMLATLRG